VSPVSSSAPGSFCNERRSNVFEKVLETLKVATELDPMGYNAWHAWALANYQAAGHHGANGTQDIAMQDIAMQDIAPASLRRATSTSGTASSGDTGLRPSPEDQLTNVFQAAAVRGFFRSVSLGQDRPRSTILQDILRLITLWFNHGEAPEVYEAMRTGMQWVSIDTWLDVLIQLIGTAHNNIGWTC
jgi:FKBP12-rapamycin complex-associated protein